MTPTDFKQLFTACQSMMWQVAASMMQSPSEAQDVVADTVEKLWHIREKLDEIENVKGYVMTTVRRTALDALRSRNRKGHTVDVEEMPALLPDPALTPHEQLERTSELELVVDMMRLLPENQRKVLELTAFRGLDSAEVVEVTGLSIENVRVLLSRARSKLRTAYRQFYKKSPH